MQDIVFPNKNEEEYIEIAQKLGIKELVFIYKKPEDFYKGKNKFPTTNALLVSPNHVQKAKNKGALAICAGIREAIERSADIVYDFEQEEKKDKTHYRRSGLNQVLCKLATTKKVTIAFSFATILNTTGSERALILGRMAQNIKLCKKYKTKTKIASFATSPYNMRAPEDLKALFSTMGYE